MANLSFFDRLCRDLAQFERERWQDPLQLPIRTDKRGVWMPPVHPQVSKHRSYEVAVRTAKKRQEAAGEPMAVVTWHDENYVVMPAWMGKRYDDADLLVEFV
jgi:hypothetical protein